MDPPTPSPIARGIASQLALLAVVAAWGVAALFVGMMLAVSDLPMGAIAIAGIALASCPLGAAVSTKRVQRRLACRRWPLWLPGTAAAAAAPLLAAFALLSGMQAWLRAYELVGPTSADGLTAIVAVSDAGLGWGADFYAEVRVVDGGGRVVATVPRQSWDRRSGPTEQRDSMRWTGPRVLELTTPSGATTLAVP